MKTIAITSIFVFFILSGFGTYGQNKRGTINPQNKRFAYILQPGETMTINHTFDAGFYHTSFVRIDGRIEFTKKNKYSNLPVRGNFPRSVREQDAPFVKTNTTDRPLFIEVDDNVSHEEGDNPKWESIKIKVFSDNYYDIDLRWEDSDDNMDFNDAIIKITITKPGI